MITLISIEGIDFSSIRQNFKVLTTYEQTSHNKAKFNVLCLSRTSSQYIEGLKDFLRLSL